jgi:hypothetical protein
MELFTATEKLKFFFLQLVMFDVCSTGDTAHIDTIFKFLQHTARNDRFLKARIPAAVKNIEASMLTRVWQELKYRIDVCRVTRGAHIEHL